MKKAALLSTLVVAVQLAVAVIAEAQQPKKIPRVGYLTSSGNPFAFEAFRQGLHGLGYIEEKNILIEYRSAEGHQGQIAGLVSELIQLKVDVLVSTSQPAIEKAKQATKVIPVVMLAAFDPVATGTIDSLARPGGNITGVSTLGRELSSKRLELLKR